MKIWPWAWVPLAPALLLVAQEPPPAPAKAEPDPIQRNLEVVAKTWDTRWYIVRQRGRRVGCLSRFN